MLLLLRKYIKYQVIFRRTDSDGWKKWKIRKLWILNTDTRNTKFWSHYPILTLLLSSGFVISLLCQFLPIPNFQIPLHVPFRSHSTSSANLPVSLNTFLNFPTSCSNGQNLISYRSTASLITFVGATWFS